MYLNCHTHYSLKYGTISIKELLSLASAQGISCIALTDINNTSACLDFIRLSQEYNVRPVIGVDFRVGVDQAFVALAKNRHGFEQINRMLTAYLHKEIAFPCADRLEEDVFIIYPFEKCPKRPLLPNEYLGVSANHIKKISFLDQQHFDKWVWLHPVSFQSKKHFNLHRLLRAIDLNTLLSKLPKSEEGKISDTFLTPQQVKYLYENYSIMMHRSDALLAQCEVSFEWGVAQNKKVFSKSAEQDIQILRALCEEGVNYRYDYPTRVIYERIEKELEVIIKMGFAAYFLINWDMIRYAQHRDFFYVGRGSGANSLVAYCLRITDVDPIDLDLYFERFINPSRSSPPDFDMDFSWSDRDDILTYMFNRHGTEHTAFLATYNTFQWRSALRELSKVFGLPKAEIDELSAGIKRGVKRRPDSYIHLVHHYSEILNGMPSHLGMHSGGVVIADRPIYQYTATNMPPKGFPTTQFSMLEAEDVGLHKFDILSQRGLAKIKEAVQLVNNNPNHPKVDIHDIKRFKEDPKVQSLLEQGKAIGCFYIESPAMRMLLSKLGVRYYRALVAASSIIRPGVAKSGMMREYILRHKHPEKRKYIHPLLKDLMAETYGVMVYQEDVLKVAHYFAGLTLEEADVLRRGMSWKYRERTNFNEIQERFFSNCKERGYPDVTVQEVWRQIESFANYAFSKGHSASYAVESYQSLFLKAYYPLEYMVAVINNFGGFYRTEFYVHEARISGGIIHAPCIQKGENETILIAKDLYLGFILVNGLERETVKKIIRNRKEGYNDLIDFIERTKIGLEQLILLIRVGALRSINPVKKQLLWEAHLYLGKTTTTKSDMELFKEKPIAYCFPQLDYDPIEDLYDQIEFLGFPLSSPFQLLNEPCSIITQAKDIPSYLNKEILMDVYMVTVKYTRTSNKEPMYFGTFLDRAGVFVDTVHFPESAKHYPFRGRGIYRIRGKVTVEFDFYSIEVSEMHRLSYFPDPRYS